MKNVIVFLLVLFVAPATSVAAIPRFDSIIDLFRADAPLKADDIPFVRGEQSVKPCAFFPGKRMRQIKLKFTSPVYRGRTSEHAAVVFLPEGEIPQHAQGVAAIILDGRVAIGKKPELDWIEHLVVGMGVPCIVVMQTLDPKPFGATDPGHLMSMGSATFMKTGDAREAGYYALARILSAAATVGAALPELQANRFIATGCSKRGMAALIACAGDPRIVAAFPTGWNSGNIPEYTRLKGERWGWNVKPMKTGPAGFSSRDQLQT